MPLMRRLLAALLLLFALPALAALELGPGEASQPAAHALQYLEDSSHRLQLADVLALPPSAWHENKAEVFNHGYNASTWWLRVQVRNPDPEARRQLLSIAYPVLDDLEVWVTGPGHAPAHYRLGEDWPFHSRPVQHRDFVIPLPLTAGETDTVLLRVRSASSIQLPITLWQRDAFFEQDQELLLGHGLYFGTMLAMAVYNLFVFFVLRDRSYLYYVVCVLSMATFLACLNGLAFQYLWPEGTTWTNQAIIIALCSTLLFGGLFTTRLLHLDLHLPLLQRLLLVLVAISILLIAASLIWPHSYLIREAIVNAFLGCVGCLAAGVLRWRQGDSTARLYTIAWASMLTGGMLLALNKLGLLPQNPVTENAAQFGSAMEVILLSFALANRISVERRLRFAAQRDALAAQRRANETLEARVAERTEALEEANRKLAELSTTDQLTGLRNRRHLDEALRDECARSHRRGRSLAVLLMDIDHFKRFNDTFGHQVGDECLRQVAAVLADCVRAPTDRVARYGGEEFCMVLPETDVEGACAVAERIRAAIEQMEFCVAGERVPVTMSVGVAAQVPDLADQVRHLLNRADAALYQSKADGRNRVTVATGHNAAMASGIAD